MAFFSKPPAKKSPEPAKAEARPRAASARELAAQAAVKGGRHLEPVGGDITVTGASLAQWAPVQASFEVAQVRHRGCGRALDTPLVPASYPGVCCGPVTLRPLLPLRFSTGEWRNWQTRRIQVPVSERMWGFKSPLAHRPTRPTD